MFRLLDRLSCVRGRCDFVAACAAVAVAVTAFGGPAFAEPSQAQSRYSFSDEQRAGELYLDGIEKLQAGHADVARRVFETVATLFPETTAGQRAQQELARLGDDAAHAVSVSESSAIGRAVAEQDDVTAYLPSPDDFAARVAADSDGLRTRFDSVAVAITGDMTTGSLPLPTANDAPKALHQGFRPTPAWDQEVRRNASIQSRMRLEAGDRVFFSSSSAELGSRARMALAAQARWLKRWHEFEATIAGYADEPGSDEDNVALSVQRAAAVRQVLVDEGVEPGRLAIAPLGRSGRLAMCADASCRAQNRRVVTVVFVAGTHKRLGLASPPVAMAARDAKDISPAGYQHSDGASDQTNGRADNGDGSALVRQVGVTR